MPDTPGTIAPLPQRSQRLIIVVVLLLLALAAVAASYGRDVWQSRQANDGSYTYIADIDRWRRTSREREVQARFDFSLGPQLADLPLQIGDWEGADIPQSNIEVLILLEPEEYVYRRYRRADGKYVWLSLIGSHQAKSFHSPQICYDADGWNTEVSSEPIELDDGTLYAFRLVAEKQSWKHVVLYFYLYPNRVRSAADGTVLFKVTAPLDDSLQNTLDLQKEFIRQFFIRAQE